MDRNAIYERRDKARTEAIISGTHKSAEIIIGSLDDIPVLVTEVERQDVLLKRAMSIITDAIMHGIPITEEVADVRNEIVCKKNPCEHEWTDAKNEVVAGGEVCLNCGAIRG